MSRLRRDGTGVSVATLPGAEALETALLRTRWRERSLAAPPAGSSLQPVPGDRGLPVLGHSLEVLIGGPRYAHWRWERYGPVSWLDAFGIREVALLGPDATEVVFTNRDGAFSQRGWDRFIGPFFHRGLMLLDFDEHLHHRRLMQAAFTRPRLAAYMERVDEISAAAIASWPASGELRLHFRLKQLSLDLATHIFMGERLGPEADALNAAFVATVRGGLALVRRPMPGGRWSAGLRGRRVLVEYFRERLPAKRAGDSDDLFSALCHATGEDGERFTDEDVVNHMVFLMMAAHDTSTITTGAVASHLATHPEWQTRVREEAFALGDAPLSLEALDRLPLLDLVVKESLRLVAPVPSLARETVRDTEVLGHHIPAGTLVSVSPWFNHHMAELWTDPARFDPERFAEPRREDRSHRYAWVPFGGGMHKCIGMHLGMFEVKTLLVHLLRRYRWELMPGYRMRWDLTALPVPSRGLPLQVERIARG
ncbi:MAG TPA: cytochrome P450 [Candidatus Dormibacteraeota bacterium]